MDSNELAANHVQDDQIAKMKQKYLALFEPATVAIVGASSSPLKWGFRILYNTLVGNFQGALYAVNPKHTDVIGVDCYPSIAAIPDTIELAFIVLPPKYVLDGVRECVACGVKAVVVITAGFGEVEDEAARAAQDEMVRIAGDAGAVRPDQEHAGSA